MNTVIVCPFCKEKGLKSQLYNKGGSTTLMGCPTYPDENGIFHDHDMNTVTNSYKCSNGHVFITSGYKSCPNCDFGHEPPIIKLLFSR